MAFGVWSSLPPHLLETDKRLVETFHRAVAAGERRAGRHLACRIGCTACCIGPFDITAPDADRLQRGLEELARHAPGSARGVRERAGEQWGRMVAEFPGDSPLEILDVDETRREAFFASFSEDPCPVPDPGSGACLLYATRPLSCRSFGLPLLCGG